MLRCSLKKNRYQRLHQPLLVLRRYLKPLACYPESTPLPPILIHLSSREPVMIDYDSDSPAAYLGVCTTKVFKKWKFRYLKTVG